MNAPHICLRCRLQIARRSSNLGKASFVSLGKLVNNDDSSESTARELGRTQDGNPTLSASLKTAPQRNWRPKEPQPRRTGVDSVLETLFASNQRNVPPPLVSRYSQTLAEKSSESTALQDSPEIPLEALKQKFYTDKAPLEEVWALCLNLLGEGSQGGMSKEQIARIRTSWTEKVFRDILMVTSRSHLRGPACPSLPTSAEVIRVYNKHGLMQYWWDQTLWGQLGGLVELRSLNLSRTSGEDLIHQARGIIEEILDVWRLFAERYGGRSTSSLRQEVINDLDQDIGASGAHFSWHNRSNGWRGLPTFTDLLSASANLPTESVDRLLYLMPRHPNNRQAIRTSAAAIMTVDCIQWLCGSFEAGKSELVDAEPFVGFATYLGRESKKQRMAATKCLSDEGLPDETIQYVLTGWGPVPGKTTKNGRRISAKRNLLGVDANVPGIEGMPVEDDDAFRSGLSRNSSEVISVPHVDPLPEDSTWKKSEVRSLSIDLHQAIDRSDTGRATSLWQTFQGKLKVGSVQEYVREELFAQFLSAFFALRRSEQVLQVWNHMVRSGHQPTSKHWHAMIVGCTKSKDLVSMLQIWSNMLAAGVEPDMLLWTARINGLIICRKWQLGLQALEELGRAWKAEAAKAPEHKSQNDALSPSIVPIKATVRGLISIGKPNIAQSVLNWAKSHNIPPDTQIFNMLLRPAVRASDSSEVESVLSQMQARSCPPDIATLTIVLNGLLSNSSSPFHARSPADQQFAVSGVLANMEAAGLKANAYTYGTMLDGLLAVSHLNIPAARAVLDHMATNKVKPSPHVYTILITHYFSTSPPDLPAIDGLWRRIKLEKAVLDPVFYDRMIENYAHIGEIEKMTFFLRRMPQEGKSPSWVALGAVLRALVRAEEWESVRELVRDVEDEKEGLLRYGMGGWRGRREFMEMVGEVRDVAGIMGRRDGETG